VRTTTVCCFGVALCFGCLFLFFGSSAPAASPLFSILVRASERASETGKRGIKRRCCILLEPERAAAASGLSSSSAVCWCAAEELPWHLSCRQDTSVVGQLAIRREPPEEAATAPPCLRSGSLDSGAASSRQGIGMLEMSGSTRHQNHHATGGSRRSSHKGDDEMD